MWAIWDFEADDWVRELRSDVDLGGVAILAFETVAAATARAAKHWGYDTYLKARRDGWCVVRELKDGPPPEDLRTELKGKAMKRQHT